MLFPLVELNTLFHDPLSYSLTPWVNPHSPPPAVPGVYQTLQAGTMSVEWSYWSGERWGVSCLGRNAAAKPFNRDHPLANQTKAWRGISAYQNESGELVQYPMLSQIPTVLVDAQPARIQATSPSLV